MRRPAQLETTYGDPSAGITPSPTFYRTNMDGAQWQAGLGDYAYNVKGYKKIATSARIIRSSTPR